MKGYGISYGAISVLNGIFLNKGCTIGINLKTEVDFSTDANITKIDVEKYPKMDTTLARICVLRTMEHIGVEPVNFHLKIRSEIPPSKGLKSSSSVCNAIINSVLNAYQKSLSDVEKIKLGVLCAREAKVTITGAFDDACACELGGHILTDNYNDQILFRKDIKKYDVVLVIPDNSITKNTVCIDTYKQYSKEAEGVLELCENDPFEAMKINGNILSEILGIDLKKYYSLDSEILSIGISGTGPAITIVCNSGCGHHIAKKINEKTMVVETR